MVRDGLKERKFNLLNITSICNSHIIIIHSYNTPFSCHSLGENYPQISIHKILFLIDIKNHKTEFNWSHLSEYRLTPIS
jgi:hypothetical protein